MKLKHELPEPVKNRLSIDESSILFSLPIDINLSGKFSQGWLVVTADDVYALDQEGNIIKSCPVRNTKEFKASGCVGNCTFEALNDDGDVLLGRVSMRYLPAYATVARYLNRVNEGEKVRLVTDLQDDICPKCGRALPNSRVCPACINRGRILARLWEIAKPHIPLLVIATLIFWTLTGLRLVLPQLNGQMIDVLTKADSKDINKLYTLILCMALIHCGSTILNIVRGRIMVLLGGRLSRDLRQQVYAKIQALSLSYLNQRRTGDLMNRVTGDTNTVQQFIQNQSPTIINESLIFIGVLFILFKSNWRLALLVLLPAPLIVWWTRKMWRTFRRIFHNQWRSWDRANSLLQDILNGMRVVKAFGQEHREVERFRKYSRDFANISGGNEKLFSTLFPLMNFIMSLGGFLVTYYGGHLVLGEQMTLGELVKFNSYTAMMYGPLRFMTYIPRMITEAMTASERIFEVIDQEPDVRDKPNPVKHSLSGDVIIEGLRFGYQVHEPILQGIDLSVKKGEMIGLVGHSGAGKSTLINLISRFYDPDEGAIKIDGVDIRDISQEELRSQIGVVLQESFLFSGTIYENIAYAKPDATLDEVIRAAVIANAHDFIMKFPDSYDTRVGEKGQRLSGGERQRVAIARAILHNPRILILDEATASVDTDTEQKIQQALSRLIKDRTTFAIAHRLSTLRAADRLLVLEKGKMAELGTHEELIKKKGIYFKLVMAQREMSRVRGVE